MKINKRDRLVYKRMGDLKVEDEVLATDNKKRKIFSIQEQGVCDIYKIILSDGRSFRTHLKHLTPVCFRKSSCRDRLIWDNLTTEWMMNHLKDYHFAVLTDYSQLDIYDILSLFLEHENEPDDNIIPIIKDGPYITDIVKLDYQEECRCITMFDPDGQYFTDGGIITHNSTFSTLAQLYISIHYALMWHPYRFFGMAPSSIFTQCMGGWNQKKASELLLEPFVQILECSPYFKRVRTHQDLTEASAEEVAECLHWTTSSPTSCLSFQNGVNYKIINGAGSILGQNIISAVISELTMFSENGWSDEKIYTFFTKLRKRIDSRMKGNYYGRFIIDSQPNSLESPIDAWIWDNKTKKNKENLIISGERWKFFPDEFPQAWETPRTDWKQPMNLKKDFVHAFPVFKGGDGQPPKVVETAAELETYQPVDIEWAPTLQITASGVKSMKDNAEESPINFLRDQCGIPSGAADRLIYNKDWIDHTFDNNLKNIYSTIIAKAEDEPEHLIWNQVKDKFFHKILGKYHFYYEPALPRVASIDLAVSGDTAGISISHVERDPIRLDSQGNPLKVYVTDLVVPVIPKTGAINLDAFKFFILDLIRLGNMNIRHVSFDSFQSKAMMQALERAGLEVEYISVDKNNSPYLSLVDYVIHKRYYCGKSIMVKNNLLSLQMVKRKTSGTMKIDHMNGDNVYTDEYCLPGSVYNETSWTFSKVGYFAKDLTDCIAANVSLLDEHDNIYVPLHAWDPTKELERTYEGEKKKCYNLMKTLSLH